MIDIYAHPMNPTILLVPHNDGTYTVRSFTMVGGYPIAYVTADNDVLCPDCVTADLCEGFDSPVVSHFINWEDTDLPCGECGDALESAYGEAN